jgi:hypothetical protein
MALTEFLKYLILRETFLEFSGKEVTISFMPFPTPSTPLPHNHKQNGNYPRNRTAVPST